MKKDDAATVEKMWDRCPQFLGEGFGNAVVVPEAEWYAMKRYTRHLRDELQRVQSEESTVFGLKDRLHLAETCRVDNGNKLLASEQRVRELEQQLRLAKEQ